jgi:hypothetical protein
MRWAGHVARLGEERGVYRILVGKPEGKRPLGRTSRTMGFGSFPGVKRPGRVSDHPPYSGAEVTNDYS